MFGCALSDTNIFKHGTRRDHWNTGNVFFLPNISCILKRKRRVAVKYIPVLSFPHYQWQALHNSPLSIGAIWFILGRQKKKTKKRQGYIQQLPSRWCLAMSFSLLGRTCRQQRGNKQGKDAFEAGRVLHSGRFGNNSGNSECGGPGKHPAPLSPPFTPPLQDHACVRDEAVHRDTRPELRPTSHKSRSLDCKICEHIGTIKSASLVRGSPPVCT